MKKLSIIIPTYNCKDYTDELLSCLNKQITDEVEVIVIDDGTNDYVLEITDLAYHDEVDDFKELWDSQIETLRRTCGF